MFKNISLDSRKDGKMGITLHNIGTCLMDVQQYDNALIYLKQSLEIYKSISPTQRKDGNVAMTLHYNRTCLMKMQQYDDA